MGATSNVEAGASSEQCFTNYSQGGDAFVRLRFSARITTSVPGCAGGFALIEVLVAVVAILLISATVAPVLFRWIDEGKIVRAQKDADAIAAAMTRFYQDTRRWPGQAEILKSDSTTRFLTAGSPSQASFPDMTGFTGIGAVTCTSGLRGVTANVTTFTAAVPSATNTLDVNDFLLRKPAAADYPNWRGPYLTAELRADPWGRAWVINVIPLFCGEAVSSGSPAGAAGYGWILTGGGNRTLQTNFTDAKVNGDSDDVGTNLSKLTTPQ